MSFYDSASLAFLPSGGAGKDGKAYSIKPVPEYGNELVTNGGFDTDSDWTKTNATISGGVATITSTGYAYAAVVQNNVLTIGKTYKATIDVNSIIGGLIVGTSETITNSGIASVTFTATTTYLDIRRDSAFATTTAVIDNVSVREVIVDGDFTFSRGNNLAATRVDSNGLIEKGRENLFKYSNQFDNAIWQGNAVWSSGQVDKDGGTSAWTFAKINESASDFYNDTTTNGVQTFSIYAKKQIGVGLKPYFFGASNGYATFNLEDGSVYNTNGSIIIDTNVETYNSQWWRISVTINGSSGNWYLYVTDGTDTQTTDVITLQDAQLEIGLTSTEYIESGATTGLAGILEDSPRFDYSGGASCPSLLLEPSRTQLIEYSEYFDAWSSVDTTISLSSIVSPDGNKNAYLMPISIVQSRIQILPSFGSGTYTFSVYAKSDLSSTIRLLVIADGVVVQQYFNTTTDWDRYEMTFTATTSLTQIQIRSGQNDADNVYIYGAQLEEGSYPTSYIPNHSGGSVTRAKEKCNVNNVTGEIGQTQGTIFLDADLYKKTDTEFYIAISDGTLSNSIYLHQSAQSLLVNKRISGVTQFLQIIPANWSSGRNKCAITYTAAEMKIFVNGVLKDTETINGLPSGLSKLTLGSRQDNLGELASDSNFKQAVLFPTVLSNTDLEILTGTSYESFTAMATALNYTTYE